MAIVGSRQADRLRPRGRLARSPARWPPPASPWSPASPAGSTPPPIGGALAGGRTDGGGARLRPRHRLPEGHRELAAEVAAGGALLSEFPCGTQPRPWNFPVRNRIIAALAEATLVVAGRRALRLADHRPPRPRARARSVRRARADLRRALARPQRPAARRRAAGASTRSLELLEALAAPSSLRAERRRRRRPGWPTIRPPDRRALAEPLLGPARPPGRLLAALPGGR